MALELLCHLAGRTLPTVVTCVEDIDAICVLVIAGHLKATLAPPERNVDGLRSRVATVHGVTPLGQRMLRKFP